MNKLLPHQCHEGGRVSAWLERDLAPLGCLWKPREGAWGGMGGQVSWKGGFGKGLKLTQGSFRTQGNGGGVSLLFFTL